MMRTYCLDCDKNGGEGVHVLLFAVCESIQDSIGFNLFELVFGHSVRGPLKVLKEAWMSNEEPSVNLLEYVTTFKQRLMQACELARQSLQRTQSQESLRERESLGAIF